MMNNWWQAGRHRPPSELAGRVAVLGVVAGMAAALLGDGVLATLERPGPATRIVLGGGDRVLLTDATEVGLATALTLGVGRLVLFHPFGFALGRWFGHRVVDRFATGGRSPAAVRRRIGRWSTPLVLLVPSIGVAMLAGSSTMRTRRFVALDVGGAVARVALLWWLGRRFADDLAPVIDVLDRLDTVLLAIAVAGVAWSFRARRTAVEPSGRFEGRVGVIGGGVAGLVAARHLRAAGADVAVFEASDRLGGRIRSTDAVGDVRLDLGAEWFTGDADDLLRIGGPALAATRLEPYPHDTPSGTVDERGRLTVEPLGRFEYRNLCDTTWEELLRRHVIDSLDAEIRTRHPVHHVDHRGERIRLHGPDGHLDEVDRVIVTAPIAQLRSGAITFDPPLPSAKREAIDAAPLWGGVKILAEFDEPIIPTWLAFPDGDTPTGQRDAYVATAGKAGSASHVVGLLAVGSPADRYRRDDTVPVDTAPVDDLVAELDDLTDGSAGRRLVRSTAIDWSAEPFIGQAYLSDHTPAWIPRELWEPIDDRVFFAGEAATRHDDWGGAHDAARAACDAVAIIVADDHTGSMRRWRRWFSR